MNTQTLKSLASEATKTPKQKKAVKLVKEKVVLADGNVMPPIPVNNSADVLRSSLLILFKHVADIHLSIVESISDKFGIPVEELHKAITEDPRWKQMLIDPVITDLTACVNENTEKKPKKQIVISDEDELVFD
jgi:hypothetical protein